MTTKRRVTLIVEGTYPVGVGGISTWADHLIRGCSEIEFDLVRIGDLPARDAWAFELPENVASLTAVPSPATIDGTTVREWADNVATGLPPTTLAQAVGTGLAGAIGLALQRRGAKLMVTEHASYVEELCAGSLVLESGTEVPPNSRAAWIDAFCSLRDACYADADLVTSLYEGRRALQVLHGAPRERTEVIPNGVPIPAANTKAPGTDFVVGFVGRLARIKKPTEFLDVLSRLCSRNDKCRGVIVGPMDCDAEYEQEIRLRLDAMGSRVEWLGAADVATIFPKIDALVLPSKLEAQPLAVLEAMAHGVPIAAAQVGNVAEMIEHPRLGAAGGTTVEEREELCDVLSTWAEHREVPTALGRAGRERVRRHYDVAMSVDGYRAAYGRLDHEELACAS